MDDVFRCNADSLTLLMRPRPLWHFDDAIDVPNDDVLVGGNGDEREYDPAFGPHLLLIRALGCGVLCSMELWSVRERREQARRRC